MIKHVLSITYKAIFIILSPLILVLLVFYACAIGVLKSRNFTNPRISLGLEPLINYKYWSIALKNQGYVSSTAVTHLNSMTTPADFDLILEETQLGRISSALGNAFHHIQQLQHLLKVLLNSDVVITSTMGYTMPHINLGVLNYRVEPFIFKLARMRTIIIPYGGDAFVYRRIRSLEWWHGLQMSYPQNARKQKEIAKRVDFWIEKADVFLAVSTMTFDGFGRADYISPCLLAIDTAKWAPLENREPTFGPVMISHTPNHRGVKGTEILIKAVTELQSRGVPVELILLEGLQNSEVEQCLKTKADIHFDQLYGDGYAMSALEAMSCGVPVLGGFEGPARRFFDEFSYTKSCPIVSVSAETLEETIEQLVNDAQLRRKLGHLSRKFVEERNSIDAIGSIFKHSIFPKLIK